MLRLYHIQSIQTAAVKMSLDKAVKKVLKSDIKHALSGGFDFQGFLHDKKEDKWE